MGLGLGLGLGPGLGLGLGLGWDLEPLKTEKWQLAPSWHAVQLAWPSLENVNSSHLSHCPWPYLSCLTPAGHGVQLVSEAAEKLPGRQLWHGSSAVCMNLPASHTSHACLPAAGCTQPRAHGLHEVCRAASE